MSIGEAWYSSYVMNRQGPVLFFMVIEKGITAVLTNQTSINVGEFYEVKVGFNTMFEERHRARHYVTQFRRIEDLAPVRMETAKNAVHVYIRTTASMDGYVDTPNGRRAKLYNDTFGTFIDLNDLVSRDNRGQVDFEFKCKSSPMDKTKSFFYPTKIFGYPEAPPRRDIVVGFVGVKSQHDNSRYVWSKAVRDDVVLEERFFPTNGDDVAGRWIEMAIDDQDRIVEPVMIINDRFESRICKDIPEVMVTFKHDGMCQSGDFEFHMYHHEYFGYIADPDYMISPVEEGGWYRAWIIRHKINGVGSRWKISREQPMPQSLRNSGRDYSPVRQGSRAPSVRSNHGSVSSQNRCRQNSRSPPRMGNHHYSPPRTYQPSEGAPFSPIPGAGPHGFDDDCQSQRSQLYPNQRGIRKPENNYPTQTSSSVPGADDELLDSTLDGFSEYSDEDVAPAKKREVNGTSGVMKNLNNSAFISDSEDDDDFNRRPNVNGTNFVPPANDGQRTPTHSVHASELSTYGTPQGAFPMPVSVVIPSLPTVREAREVIQMRNRLQRACDIFQFFSSHPQIEQGMRLLDVEQYEEMMDIIEEYTSDSF